MDFDNLKFTSAFYLHLFLQKCCAIFATRNKHSVNISDGRMNSGKPCSRSVIYYLS